LATEHVLDDFGRLDVLANNLGNFSLERQLTSDSQARR
jgi:NAD(P)-dependent dehydrogenase (short-subunit alcohol dehydrogenase family)